MRTQQKLAQMKNSKVLYMPKGEFEINQKTNDQTKSDYKGTSFELSSDNRFLNNLPLKTVKRLKDDKLWNVINSNSFQQAIKKESAYSSDISQEPANKYIVVLRGFLSYWLQKKYSSLGVNENDPDSILKDFLAAYDLQMELIAPDMRTLWMMEYKNDRKRFDQRFIQIDNIQQLRRLLANKHYGTKPHLPKEKWEAPML